MVDTPKKTNEPASAMLTSLTRLQMPLAGCNAPHSPAKSMLRALDWLNQLFVDTHINN
jgi:hypothetical protein